MRSPTCAILENKLGMGRFICLGILLLAWALPSRSQIMEGELRVTVSDPAGRPVSAALVLSSRNPSFQAATQAGSAGHAILRRLPQGVHQLTVTHPGFEPFTAPVEIRSAVPHSRTIVLRISTVAQEVTVRDTAPVLDRSQPSLIMRAGLDHLTELPGTTLGRSAIDTVTSMPGWLLEANAVLHPRGSEYDTQYVIDGMPLYDNRSLSFAPAFENVEFEAINIMTAGIPAEFGRRLGGVIALDTRRIGRLGHTTEANLEGGSFGTFLGSLVHQQRRDRTAFSMGLHGGSTDRYLDPPSLQNFTNYASAAGLQARLEHDLSSRDRLALYLRSNRTGFLVPNDLSQQAAGQRQDRAAAETAGQIHYQHTFSAGALASFRGMIRDLNARLWSNPLSTPVWVDHDRGFREGALIGAFTLEGERHTLKFGADLRVNSIRESFRFAEADEFPELGFDFQGRRRSTETSAFVQEHLRWGNFAAALGLRLDSYRLLLTDTAFSPRLALSYYIPQADLMVRAAYDRIFQPPPSENLLVSSAVPASGLDGVTGALPVPASRANFFEVGIRKPFAHRFRVDVSHYWRTFQNYIDDDVFLNTGLSFPITFSRARITGTEVRVESPRWGPFSSFVSYSNMLGTANSPVTGGLFIAGGEAEELRFPGLRFPISQDQRNTLAAQVRFQPSLRTWFLAGVRYGSGLPVELEDDDDEDEDDDDEDEDGEQAVPSAILEKVDFQRGRIRPNFSLDLGAGFRLWERDARSASLQFGVRNLTDRLNVVNFSGLFSGTALAPGRQISLQLRLRL